MKSTFRGRICIVVIFVSVAGAALLATAATPAIEARQTAPEGGRRASEVSVDKHGTVYVPAYQMPLSSYMSEPAKRAYIDYALNPRIPDSRLPIAQYRAAVDKYYRPLVERGRALYPVDIQERKIGDIRTDMVIPQGGVSLRNSDRVLINLHGGGFMVGGGLGGLAESIPIASVGKVRVISVDYRMAPEYRFPAASEDVAAVYRELLEQYGPENIGIYGCSAGGMLTAMAVAWFQKENLPAPGAIGLFCMPDGRRPLAGDSGRFALPLSLAPAPTGMPPPASPTPSPMKLLYWENANLNDPLFSPFGTPSVLSRFPPTLLISGTRDPVLSGTLYTHRALVKAGVQADLHVWDGMWHNFLFEMNLPESREAYDVIVKFFEQHLGKGGPNARKQ